MFRWLWELRGALPGGRENAREASRSQWLSSPDKILAAQGLAEEMCWAQWARQPTERRDEVGKRTGRGEAQAVWFCWETKGRVGGVRQ